MLSKKKFIIISVMFLVGLTLIFRLDLKKNRDKKSADSKIRTTPVEKTVTKRETTELSAKLKEQSKILNNIQLSQKERVNSIIWLSESSSIYHLEILKHFIVSPSGYQKNDPDPHGLETQLFVREASLRVFAMKQLYARLAESEVIPFFKEIADQASDEGISNVAKEVIKYAKEEKSFFDEIVGGIKSMEIPE